MNNLKIIQINKGNSPLSAKVPHIINLLNHYNPNVMIINELNLSIHDSIIFPGYNFEFDQLHNTHGTARTGILIKENIIYKRRKDLESPKLSTVWIQLNFGNKNKLLIQAVYRQWKLLTEPGSETTKSRFNRFEKIIKKWKVANQEKVDVLTLGDFNLNALTWGNPYHSLSLYDRAHQKYYNIIKSDVLDNGTYLVKTGPTRQSNTINSQLDHVYTNNLAKIKSTKVLPCFSDHDMTLVEIFQKVPKPSIKFIKSRMFNDLDYEVFNEQILQHYLYIETLQIKDPNIISQNIQKILTDILDNLAPIKRIQIRQKKQAKLNDDLIQLIDKRNEAHKKAKESNDINDIRLHRNLRNETNKQISIHKFQTLSHKFANPDLKTSKQKWNLIKDVTGQSKNNPPEIIMKENSPITSPKQIANTMNKEYVKIIKETINKIPKNDIDPIKNYKENIGEVNSKFIFKEITMHELRKILSSMKPTGSTSNDYISMKTIKKARKTLEPILLNMVNSTISKRTYSDILKIIKILPIHKPGKDPLYTENWRPINLVPSLSKIIEKVLSLQIWQHLNINNLIHHNHHGGINGRSTQTLVLELYDILLEAIEKGEDMAVIAIDQSKSFEIVDHPILIKKLQVIGFDKSAIDLITSYLDNRKQYVQINGFDSDLENTGPLSVAQGSILSGLLHLIFILDLPDFFHNQKHDPLSYRQCKNPNAKTFVDDCFIAVKYDNKPIQESINQNLKRAEDYMSSNKLAMNIPKTQVMILSSSNETKSSFSIKIGEKEIKHSETMKLIGNTINDQLNFDNMIIHGNDSLENQLKNRLRSIELISKYMKPDLRKQYVSSIFRGKLLFGINTWGGTSKSNINKLQILQDRASKLALPNNLQSKSSNQRQTMLGWMSIEDEIRYSTNMTTFNMINSKSLEELKPLMPLNNAHRRIEEHRKLGIKPRILNSSLRYQRSFRNRAYSYNLLPGDLTKLRNKSKFKKYLRRFLLKGLKPPRIR